MSVLLFDVFKHLLLRKTDVLKTCRKGEFFGKKIWRYELTLKSKKVQSIFGKTFILALLSTKPCLNFFKDFFSSGDKRLLSEFLRIWGWFQGHNEYFPKYLA